MTNLTYMIQVLRTYVHENINMLGIVRSTYILGEYKKYAYRSQSRTQLPGTMQYALCIDGGPVPISNCSCMYHVHSGLE